MLWIDFQKELDVRIVETMKILQAANKVKVSSSGFTSRANCFQISAKQEEISVLKEQNKMVFKHRR